MFLVLVPHGNIITKVKCPKHPAQAFATFLFVCASFYLYITEPIDLESRTVLKTYCYTLLQSIRVQSVVLANHT